MGAVPLGADGGVCARGGGRSAGRSAWASGRTAPPPEPQTHGDRAGSGSPTYLIHLRAWRHRERRM